MLQHVFVTLIAETPSFCAGSREPSMICQVQSKEVFADQSKIAAYYPKFFEVLKQATNIPGNRFVNCSFFLNEIFMCLYFHFRHGIFLQVK